MTFQEFGDNCELNHVSVLVMERKGRYSLVMTTPEGMSPAYTVLDGGEKPLMHTGDYLEALRKFRKVSGETEKG